MRKTSLLTLIAVSILLAGVALARLSAQDVAEVVRGTDKIPKGFKTYSLFLICNPQWLAPEKTAGLYKLYRDFQNFGRTIGDANVAVWFWKTRSAANDTALAQNVDVERSVQFCQAWKLKPSAGPHVVVTAGYPDEAALSSGLPKDSAVFELGNMSPKEVSDLLAKLTDELIATGRVESSAPAADAKPNLWVGLLQATQQTLNNFGCAWSFKIDAGPVKADLHSCATHEPT